MTEASQAVEDLDYWLQHIASIHPREIELGLDRSRQVACRLDILQPAANVVTIAGTNGKGSCVHCLEAILLSCGHRVGSFTSPHIHRFNERIKIAGKEVSDEDLCRAFAVIDEARADISLSYFEFATLAALWLFKQQALDAVILEVGLGGRLDSVNIVDASLTLISSISLDHEDWLGSDIEAIAREKSGILRHGVPLLVAEERPPESIAVCAAAVAAPMFVLTRDFQIRQDNRTWKWTGFEMNQEGKTQALEIDGLSRAGLLPANAAAALQAAVLMPLELDCEAVRESFKNLHLPGRFEQRSDRDSGRCVILDVAHNPAAVRLLAEQLAVFQKEMEQTGQIAVVMAVMADKDIEEMVSALESCAHIWYISQVEDARCMPVKEAANRLAQVDKNHPVHQFKTVEEAYRCACDETSTRDIVVVTGSFLTVAAIRELSDPRIEIK